jgi:Na+/H+ antiporter NhaD/arsenite permease-like protein
MPLAELSLAALVLAIAVSCVSEVNVGFLAIALAWVVGVYLGGMTVGQLVAGFPAQLFLTLAGVTLLFSQAQVNGTLDRIAHRSVRLCRGNAGTIGVMFFVLALALASIGPGNIASAALVAPIAMGVAGQLGIPAFLMAIMVGNGANAGSLSPIAPTGIIVNEIMTRGGMPGYAAENYLNNMLAHTTVAFAGYFLLGGWRLFRRGAVPEVAPASLGAAAARPLPGSVAAPAFERAHWITMGVIATLIASVILFGVNVGMGAFAGAVLLTLVKAADEKKAIQAMPWRVIMMVTGVTVLIALLEKTGGMDLFTALLARASTPETVTGVTAFFTGIISIYSSTSGVVLPAFLPTVPGLVERLGGGDPLAIASSMNVGSHLVDVSPLSTIGALCLACAPQAEDHRALFNKLMAWGLSMAVVGAALCWIAFGWLGIP